MLLPEVSQKNLNIVFAGTPDISAKILTFLLEQTDHHVSGILTQPDRQAGRGRQLKQSSVKQIANEYGIDVYQPEKINQEILDTLHQLQPDLIIVVAYGLMLPLQMLTLPKYGCWNVHMSLLPRWRGAAPIQRAIQGGDKQTGVTIMQMDQGLDTGDILYQRVCDITSEDTSASLYESLTDLAIETLRDVLRALLRDELPGPTPQTDAGVTYAKKLTKAEGKINWQQPATQIDCHIRAMTPWPGAFFRWEGQNIKIDHVVISSQSKDEWKDKSAGTILSVQNDGLYVATETEPMIIQKLQLPGGKMMPVQAILNGHPTFKDWVGYCLASD